MREIIAALDHLGYLPENSHHNDGLYRDMDLNNVHITTGFCEARGIYGGVPYGDGGLVIDRFYNEDGYSLPVDCATLITQLNTLLEIARVSPAQEFMANFNSRRAAPHAITIQDLYVYFLVESMISELLLGTTQTLPQIFETVATRGQQDYAGSMAQSRPELIRGTLNFQSIQGARVLFRTTIESYGLDPTPFEPVSP